MEIIEIIDTAVKIGLGAVITAIATHNLADKNLKNDLKKRKIDNDINLIKDLAIKLEHAEALLNEGTHSYGLEESGSKFDASSIISATKLVYEARAMANLLGEDDLAKGIGELAGQFEEIYSEFRKENNHDNVDDLIKMMDKSKVGLYPLISFAYGRLA